MGVCSERASKRIRCILAGSSLLLLLVQVLLPWLGAWVTQDGPSHVYNAGVAWQLLTRGPESAYAASYSWNVRPVPNWTVTVLLWLFDERFAASLLIALSYLAVAYALRVFAPELPPWSPLVNVLIHTWFLYMGFYNFYLGAATAVAWVAWWQARQGDLRTRDTVLLSAGAMGLYFTHLLAWAAAMFVAALLAWGANRITRVILIALPSAALAVWYLSTSPDSADWGGLAIANWNETLGTVGKAWAVTRWGSGTQVLALAGFVLLVVRACLASRFSKPLMLAAGAFAAAACVVPEHLFGGGYVAERLWWFAAAFGLLASARLAETRVFAECLAALVLLVSVAQVWAAMQQAGAERTRVAAVCAGLPDGVRLARAVRQPVDRPALPVLPELRLDPLLHACSAGALQRSQTLLSDYQALTGYFPLLLRNEGARTGLRALDHSQGLELDPLLRPAGVEWIVELLPAEQWRAAVRPAH